MVDAVVVVLIWELQFSWCCLGVEVTEVVLSGCWRGATEELVARWRRESNRGPVLGVGTRPRSLAS